MACVSSTRVLGGWLWSRRSRWPCHGMSKVSVLFIDEGTHRKSGFVIGRYGNMIPRLAERAVHCTRIFPLPPSLVSTRSLILPRDASSSPTPLRPSTFPREGDGESPRSRPSPKTNITLHLVTACNVRDLRSAWNFIFDGLRFADERKTEPSVHLPSSSIRYYPRICGFFSAIFSSFFFFFLEKLLRRLFNFGRFDGKSCVLCIPLTKG